MKLTTEVFSLSPGVYSRLILNRLLARYLWVFLLPGCCFAVLGFVFTDAWRYVALIYVFLLVPLFLFFAYFSATLRSEAVESLLPHRITIDGRSAAITYYRENGEDKAARSNDGKAYVVYKDDADRPLSEFRTKVLAVDGSEQPDFQGKWLIIKVKEDEKHIVLIPREAVVAINLQ